LGNSFPEPISKQNPSQKGAGGVAQSVGPEFKPQNVTKNKRRQYYTHLKNPAGRTQK
jgi:hypothetical protein